MAPLISALLSAALSLALYASTATTQDIYSSDKSLSGCPGYTASQVQDISDGFMADLSLAGPACNVYGTDVQNLTLTVQYQTSKLVQEIVLRSFSADLLRPCKADDFTSSSRMQLNRSTKSPSPCCPRPAQAVVQAVATASCNSTTPLPLSLSG